FLSFIERGTRELGRAVVFGELDGDPAFRQSFLWIAFRVGEIVGVDDSFRRHDFVVDRQSAALLAFGTLHAVVPLPTGAKIHGGDGKRPAFGTPPSGEIFRFAPRLKNQFARRVKDTSDDKLSIRWHGDLSGTLLVDHG